MKKAMFSAFSLVAILVISSGQASAGVRATGSQTTAVNQPVPRDQALAGTWSWIADLIHGWLDQRAN